MEKWKRLITVCLAIAMVWTGIPVNTLQAAGTSGQEADIQQETDIQQQTDLPQEADLSQGTKINYVVLDKNYVTAPDTQKIVVSVGDENTSVEQAVLTYRKEGTEETAEAAMEQAQGGAILFSVDFTPGQAGVYLLERIAYTANGQKTVLNFSEIGIETKFGVDAKTETAPDAVLVEEEEVSEIVTFDENGEITSHNSMEEAIDEASQKVKKNTKAANGKVVVVLDPGHDSTHAGAQANGLSEEKLNLKIAKYCKEELEKYENVTVYMTRGEDGKCPFPGSSAEDCNAGRVAFAKSVGADVLVSLHLNSNPSSSPNGSEIYYPNKNYNSAVSVIGGELADKILEELEKLGLNIRGKTIRNSQDNTKNPDGSLADYYGIIRRSKLEGIPAIIVEHAFLTNQNDVNTYLKTEAGLKSLGVADATGIAAYYGLSKPGSVKLSGIYYVETEEFISAAAAYTSSAKSLEFRWMEYNVNKGSWSILSDWSSRDSIQWKPQQGPYWLRVEVRADDGTQKNCTLVYNSTRDYQRGYLDLYGIFQIAGEEGISSAVSYKTNDAQAQFRWLQYDVKKGIWTILSDWSSKESILWRPKAGAYWLRVEARTGTGIEKSYTLPYNNEIDYTRSYLQINGIYQIAGEQGISSAVSYKTNDKSIKFRWLEYDVNKGKWTILSDWSSTESIVWKPTAGAYWLRVEAKTSDGTEKEYTLAYNNTRDYANGYVEIQGIYYIEDIDGINAGAVHITNDTSTKFRWLVYNVDKQSWTVLSDWKKAETVTWRPEAGNYWLRVEAKTDRGAESTCTIEYKMDKYEIMGTTGTSLQQMVSYYKSKASYPDFYKTSDAPTIEMFCQIYLEECAAEGVKAEVAFAQAMKETGFLRYGGQVNISQFNFAGIGATDGGGAGASFPNVRTGVRAQVQHLKAYASKDKLNNACVDPRFSLVKRGTAPYVEWLGQKENPQGYGWATDKNYGYSLKNDYIYKLMKYKG